MHFDVRKVLRGLEDGEPAVIQALWERFAARLLRRLRSRYPYLDAEDLLQESFVRYLRDDSALLRRFSGRAESAAELDDAAEATRIAIEGGPAGLYNMVDDEPAEAVTWLPELARAIGAPPPRHVPVWLGRLLAGEALALMMTEIRGSSNAKARRDLGWRPRYPTWREGFRSGLS